MLFKCDEKSVTMVKFYHLDENYSIKWKFIIEMSIKDHDENSSLRLNWVAEKNYIQVMKRCVPMMKLNHREKTLSKR